MVGVPARLWKVHGRYSRAGESQPRKMNRRHSGKEVPCRGMRLDWKDEQKSDFAGSFKAWKAFVLSS